MELRKHARLLMIGILIILTMGVVGMVGWATLSAQEATERAVTVLHENGVQLEDGRLVFQPSTPTDNGLIYYPGGLVDPAAYAPLMRKVSERGILAVAVPMPLNLAVFAPGRAAEVMAAFPDIEHWIVGGHSLGGSMAAEFVVDNPAAAEGLALLASYPGGDTDLSSAPLAVVSLYGSRDGVAGDDPAAALGRLPATTRLLVIEGGNHAQFGDYGPQRGDGTATISREDQQRQTAAAIAELAAEVAGEPAP